MNILVVNENFTGGGLETHIHSYYMELRNQHHFVFAFGNFDSDLEFATEDVYTGFHFSWNCSIAHFIDDVERLVQLIQKENIDVIHAHPFHSIFPAAIAGQLIGVPVVCTHHGTYSFAFPGGINEALLLYYTYLELVSCVFSVSDTERAALKKRVHVPDVVFMPNAVDSRLYRHHTIVNNRRWAAVSRLGADMARAASLEKLFDMLPQLPIDGVDVYGDGTQRKELERYVAEQGLSDRVRFMGWCTDLYNRLDGQYNGIIGSDRVALEGLTMGYPVLEIGYGRICGLLYGDLLQRAKGNNFVANILSECDSDVVASQLEQVYANPQQFDFRREMVDTFDIQIVAASYIKQLSSLSIAPHANIAAWFEEVKILPNLEVSFYSSQDVFQTIVKCIKPYTIDRNMLDLFLLGTTRKELSDGIEQLQKAVSGQIQFLNEIQVQLLSIGEEKRRLQGALSEQMAFLERTQQCLEQTQAQITNLEENHRQLQAQLHVQMQLLEQQQEQIEYHRKILAPLIWLRKFLSRIKWKIKGWFQ